MVAACACPWSCSSQSIAYQSPSSQFIAYQSVEPEKWRTSCCGDGLFDLFQELLAWFDSVDIHEDSATRKALSKAIEQAPGRTRAVVAPITNEDLSAHVLSVAIRKREHIGRLGDTESASKAGAWRA